MLSLPFPRRVIVLGATGSVGQQAIAIIAQHPDKFDVVALVAGSNADSLATQARLVKAKHAVLADATQHQALAAALAGTDIQVSSGNAAVLEAASLPCDIVVAAIVGVAGLAPTVAALAPNRFIALANKECLVAGGHYFLQAVRRVGAHLLAVDSEHFAIQSLLQGLPDNALSSITLTASGGPLRGYNATALQAVTPAMALKHPTWRMGAKISIDSATLMNKGLEIIEAHYLFNLPLSAIKVLVHPQSIIHGMVTLRDGSLHAQLSLPSMAIPIAAALFYPQRLALPAATLDLAQLGSLTFAEPDHASFPAITLARHSVSLGDHGAVILNAANELAVQEFLSERLPFTAMMPLVERLLERFANARVTSLQDIVALDAEVRHTGATLLKKVA